MQRQSTQKTYGGEGGTSGRTLVVALVVILLALFLIKGWQMLESGGSFGPVSPPKRTLPAEPLLDGLDTLEGEALQARMRALGGAIACIERGTCTDVADPGRVRTRPSLPFREALRGLQRRARAAEGGR
jgi:hypothetical protein